MITNTICHYFHFSISTDNSATVSAGCLVLQKGGCKLLKEFLQNQDAPEKYKMKAHFLLRSVVYNIVPFYVLFIVYTHISFCDWLKQHKKNVHPLVYKTPSNVCLYFVGHFHNNIYKSHNFMNKWQS